MAAVDQRDTECLQKILNRIIAVHMRHCADLNPCIMSNIWILMSK